MGKTDKTERHFQNLLEGFFSVRVMLRHVERLGDDLDGRVEDICCEANLVQVLGQVAGEDGPLQGPFMDLQDRMTTATRARTYKRLG